MSIQSSIMTATLAQKSVPLPYQDSPEKGSPAGGQLNSINDLILHKAKTVPNTPLIAYPISKDGQSRLLEYTSRDIDLFVDATAKELDRLGLKPQNSRSDQSEVVAMIGPSNLDYVISLLALSRMGFTVLFLSTRLHTEAYVSLLQKTNCTKIVASDKFSPVIDSIQSVYPLRKFPLLDRSLYTKRNPTESRFQRSTELVKEEDCIAFIVHSSGSTGLPKPIFQTHRSCLSNYALGSGMRAFVTLPLFHNHGLATTFRGIVANKRTVLYNAELPLTNANLVTAMELADPESFNGVPFALKVLSESEEGISALRKCKLVLFGGSSCPDELGDKLVNAGVYLVGHYGATEMGQLMTSLRDPEDKSWNYVRPLPKVKPYLRFVPIGEGMYECVVLDGLPTKVMSNSDDPPNSYYTRDTFVPHPTISDAWKYKGRLDDRITLFNGEKVLPIPYENQVRQNELISDCLVFGVGMAFPGLLVFPSENAAGMNKSEILQQIAPTIELANSRAEKFGYVSPEMIEIMDRGIEYPRTDKGTTIRAACYKKFSDIIDAVYQRFENPDAADEGSGRVLDQQGMEQYLLDLFTRRLGIDGISTDTDLFEAGTDSLQSLRARSYMMHDLYLAGKVLEQNVVYEHPSVKNLARYLSSLNTGTGSDQKDELKEMKELINKYSSFQPFRPGCQVPEGDVVLLTGATGTLGAHILSQLLQVPHVRAVYCLVRAKSESAAMERVTSTLSAKLLSLSNADKVIAVPSDLSKADLGLEPETFSHLQSTVTTVIHSAWAVNFNLGVSSFENHHIRGTWNLLRLCHSVPFARPARFSFVSSVSAAAGTPAPAVVREALVDNPAHAQNMGYARSKYVTEHIVRAAAASTGQQARVLRTGQIVFDTTNGLWNQTEAIPLMIRSATTIGALPSLDETPSWLPVDKCAEAILQLSEVAVPFNEAITRDSYDPDVVFHVQNPTTFRWTEDLLPALRDAGLHFETVPQREWVRRLRECKLDVQKNPTLKLVEFFADKYDNDRPGRKGLVFSTEKTAERSQVIRDGIDAIEGGLIAKCVRAWEESWNKTA
ncbi:hypothetical protein IWZ00DRAFT_183202 [Phyllosticta capitalensis]|uniref:uncharacterized protein n=1 Tax=Phyllosticta capitalensis TaxID=121624 RepID=UPI00312D1FC0